MSDKKSDLEITSPAQIKDLTTYTNEVIMLRKFFSEKTSGVIQVGNSFIKYDRDSSPSLKPLSALQKIGSVWVSVDLTPSVIKFLDDILKSTPRSDKVESSKLREKG